MTNGEKIKALLKPKEYQIRINENYVEIEIQRFGINFDCDLDWWKASDTVMSLDAELIFSNVCRFIKDTLTELDNIDDYAARLEKYGEEDKAEGLLEASARIRNTMQKVLDCPPEKEGE